MPEYTKYAECLNQCLERARDETNVVLENNQNEIEWITTITDNSGSSKAALAVTITCILKKHMDAEQDIRLHQAGMVGGYSGRGLDTKITTPFLQLHYFPAPSSTGWLTRSFEQSIPYTLEYPGHIKPSVVKSAFLKIINSVQNGNIEAEDGLVLIFRKLLEKRERERVELVKPEETSRIQDIIDMLSRHFTADYGTHGASRLPVLAIYAAYERMLCEVERYKDCELQPMESHTAADSRTGAVGDIEIYKNGKPFEGLEIKHGQAIDLQMINTARDKFKATSVERYYLLTTHEEYGGSDEIAQTLLEIHRNDKCQVIVNGVMHTLRYYLRLLDSPADFAEAYLRQLDSDPTVLYEHKSQWNRIAREGVQE